MKNSEFVAWLQTRSETEKTNLLERMEGMLKTSESDLPPEVCPICGAEHPKLIKKGKSNGKQRYLHVDPSCNIKFTYDTNKITSWMRVTDGEFMMIAKDTMNGVAERVTAVKLNRSPACIHSNRMKFLKYLTKSLHEEERMDLEMFFHKTNPTPITHKEMMIKIG